MIHTITKRRAYHPPLDKTIQLRRVDAHSDYVDREVLRNEFGARET